MMRSMSLTEFQAWLRSLFVALDAALERGLTKAVLLTNNAARARLNGEGEPWSYPVPVRTGTLRRLQQSARPSPTLGLVFNTATYAAAIHSGYVSRWAGRNKHVMSFRRARPFADDAVGEVQPGMVIAREITQELDAWA